MKGRLSRYLRVLFSYLLTSELQILARISDLLLHCGYKGTECARHAGTHLFFSSGLSHALRATYLCEQHRYLVVLCAGAFYANRGSGVPELPL